MAAGLKRHAAAAYPLASAGIDSWAVDYGLLDASGALIGNPVHYRDSRTDGVSLPVSASELYAMTGIQYLPFNTIFQVAAAAGTPALACARTLLLIPDLLAYWLTGKIGAEVTNASTTALLDVSSRTWATGLMERVGISPRLFPALRQPGDMIGAVMNLRQAKVRTRRGGWKRRCRWSPSGRMTPRRRWSRCRRTGRTSLTSRREPGRWSGWNWPRQW